MTPENRIPELDFVRGISILGMIAVHLIYDLTEIYPVFKTLSPAFLLLKNSGGIVFFLISGISVTLGHRHLRRGLIVFGCGILVSAVTVLTGFLPIRFGVLQSLGACMLCWEIFRKASSGPLAGLGLTVSTLGWAFEEIRISCRWLYPLGLTAMDFQSADYFPLFPYLGYFLLGACFGRIVYAQRKSLFPRLSFPPFFCFCGRHSLALYLIHQPVLIFLIETVIFIGGSFHEI